MNTRTYEVTNVEDRVQVHVRLSEAIAIVNQLIEWADADYNHATAHDAPGIARDDFRRGTDLRKARELLEGCIR